MKTTTPSMRPNASPAAHRTVSRRPDGRPVLPMLLMLAALAGGAAALGGCSSPPTRFYTVEPAAPVAAGAVGRYAGPPLRVRAVHLPPAWDRAELIREIGPGQVRVREFDQWAAPLGRSTRQALIQDLAARMPAGAVLLSQLGPGGGTVPMELSVDILSLKVDGQTASMVASWSVRRTPTEGWRSPPPAALEVPLTGDNGEATALALSRLIGQLADRIVQGLGDGAAASN